MELVKGASVLVCHVCWLAEPSDVWVQFEPLEEGSKVLINESIPHVFVTCACLQSPEMCEVNGKLMW